MFSSSAPFNHQPVLCQEIVEHLRTQAPKTIIDGTTGLGGHAEALLKALPELEEYVAIDLDPQNLATAKERLATWGSKVRFFRGNFSVVIQNAPENLPRPLVILLDLGLCSSHLDGKDRGFSFLSNGPLCLRFDGDDSQGAGALLARTSAAELVTILRQYGEEPAAKKIAQYIYEEQKKSPILTTQELRELIMQIIPPPFQKKTLQRVFQALRIAVNDELGHLQQLLEFSAEFLCPQDQLAVISYHSLEDRIVKQFFKKMSEPKTIDTVYNAHHPVAPARWRTLTRQPLRPTAKEVEHNPRARSARLRFAQCL